jgi:hypothetical protein
MPATPRTQPYDNSQVGCRPSQQQTHKHRHRQILINSISDQHRHIPGVVAATHSPSYLFYNAELIEECDKAPDVTLTGYMDNVGILA